jgi:putative effector of murein hydrolase LrgA (UPF0299 family)
MIDLLKAIAAISLVTALGFLVMTIAALLVPAMVIGILVLIAYAIIKHSKTGPPRG